MLIAASAWRMGDDAVYSQSNRIHYHQVIESDRLDKARNGLHIVQISRRLENTRILDESILQQVISAVLLHVVSLQQRGDFGHEHGYELDRNAAVQQTIFPYCCFSELMRFDTA